MSMLAPYLHVTFCDDVRQEVNGRTVFLGVYAGQLLVPSFPLLMPKFHVMGHYYWPRTQPEWAPLGATLMRDDLEPMSFDLPPAPPIADVDGTRGHLVNMSLVLSPMELLAEHRLALVVQSAAGEVMGSAFVGSNCDAGK